MFYIRCVCGVKIMEGLPLIIIGTFTVGFIVGKLQAGWTYYKKTGEMIEDVKDKFKG